MKTKKRVLIVEDDRDVLDMLRVSFEQLGCAVDCAESIRGGLAHVREKGLPDLIVCDLNFLLFDRLENQQGPLQDRPERLGFEFHRSIARKCITAKAPMPPFILHTADDDEQTQIQARDCRMHYVKKGYGIGPTLMQVATTALDMEYTATHR